MGNLERLVENVEQWSKDKDLHKQESKSQMLKVYEEVSETAVALNKGYHDELVDGIGDSIVTLIILAQQNGLTIEQCLNAAYSEIEDRTGELVNGSFVKSEDLR